MKILREAYSLFWIKGDGKRNEVSKIFLKLERKLAEINKGNKEKKLLNNMTLYGIQITVSEVRRNRALLDYQFIY